MEKYHRTIFRSQNNNYNSDVGEEYIDIGGIIGNNATDLRIQLVEEQRLIQQEIQEIKKNKSFVFFF